ncbi:hypothetical protein FOZ61_006909 [Perkinsus olseni]|uniref:Uncharacterized protein n=1 Tax=Perkinsus olseni TaxID=32597 RepID=A0A7J6LBC0_PEROL|nr:hypothetical protein FOZ61_006909 [Perkinsus olseni]
MPSRYRLVAIASIIVASDSTLPWFVRRFSSRNKEATRVDELRRQGVRCKIMQRAPLEDIDFRITISPRGHPSPGTVLATALDDTTRGYAYNFDNSYERFYGKVGDVEIRRGDKEVIWEALRRGGFLPLDHLSPKARKVLRENAPRNRTDYVSEKGCRRITEAIIDEPPAEYERFKGTTGWIPLFHRDRKWGMEKEMARLKQLQEDEERRKEARRSRGQKTGLRLGWPPGLFSD